MTDKPRLNLFIKLFLIALFLLPFTALPYFKNIFREVSGEGAFYLLFPLVMMVLANNLWKFKISVLNEPIFKIWTFYLIYIFIVFVINFNTIANSNLIGKNGIERFILQYLEFIFGFLVVYSITYILNDSKKLEFVFSFIALIVSISVCFSLYQFLAFNYGGILMSVYKFIYPIIFQKDVFVEGSIRVHGFGGEPSHLAFFLSVLAPYATIFFIKKKKLIMLLLLCVVVGLTLSRTLYITALIEIIILSYFIKHKYYRFKEILYFLPILIILIILILISPLYNTLSSTINVAESGSSYTRFVVILAALQAFFDHNIWIGLGLGQTGFFSYQYMSEFPGLSPEIMEVINYERWPFIHNLHVRLLVETGIVGFIFWITLLYNFMRNIYIIVKRKYLKTGISDKYGYAVLASLVGMILAGFSRENLTNMNIWVCLGLALAYMSVNKEYLINIDKKNVINKI